MTGRWAQMAIALLLAGGAADMQQSESGARLSRPSFDPFAEDRTWDGGVDGQMTIRGDLIEIEGDCGRLRLQRISGEPLLMDGPGIAYRTRIEAYERNLVEEWCEAEVGNEAALVAQSIILPAEFATPPGIIVSVQPLAGNHVMPWSLVAFPLRPGGP